MRLIDAVELVRDIDIAFKGIKASDEEFERFRDLCGLIWMQPTVVPVKHGRWVDRYGDGDWHCTCCGAIVEKHEQDYKNWYFCYHCGAKMDEVEE